MAVEWNITPDGQWLECIGGEAFEIAILKKAFNPFVPGYRFVSTYKMGIWDGKEDFWKGGILPIGLWQQLEQIALDKEIELKFYNIEKFPKQKVKKAEVWEFFDEYFKDHRTKDEEHPFSPREYQREAVLSLLKQRYSMVEVATGGGKSLIFSSFVFYYLSKVNPLAKVLLIVPSVSLVKQFRGDILDYAKGYNGECKSPLDIRVLEKHSQSPVLWNDPKVIQKLIKLKSDKTPKGKIKFQKYLDELPPYSVDLKNTVSEPNIVIGTFQSLCKLPKEWFKQWDIVTVDEGHTAKSDSIATIFNHCKTAVHRIGMSGTFPNTGMSDWFRIQSLIGPVLYKVPAIDLIQDGSISQLHINGMILKWCDDEFNNAIGNIKKSDGGRAFQLEKTYAQKSTKRTFWISQLCQKLKGNSLVMFHIIEYGQVLFNTIKQNCDAAVFYIDGMTSAEDREYIKKEMNIIDDTPRILVATYGTLSTGISIDGIYNIVFAESFKEQKLIRQTIGRGLRKHSGKAKLQVWDIVDVFTSSKKPHNYNNIMWKQWEARIDIYKSQKFSYSSQEFIMSDGQDSGSL
jgi:superfamily II DNA or RNA helicase